jgi:preprotein translocase subunit SecG
MKWLISFLIGIAVIYLGWQWQPLLVTLHVLLCFALILVVLLQSGKAADLAGAFGGAGSQTAFGPRGAATFLSQATTWCAVMFMLTSISLVVRQTQIGPSSGSGSILEGTAPAPTPAPATPAPAQPAPGQTPPAGQQTPPAGQPQPAGQNPPAQNPQTPPAPPKQ